jgi:predicted SnoaL-like aldol condensation-catalyzing enzyme
MSVEANKLVARRFVQEVLDAGNAEVEREITKDGAPRHFPARETAFDHAGRAPTLPRRSMKTTVHHLIGEGDYVSIHLTHRLVCGPGARFPTRAGTADLSDKTVEWNAMVVLRFEDGKIAEEWVVRDELQILLQSGAVRPLAG